MNSFWDFEDEEQLNELPQHKSDNYIDIDFIRNLLFINFKNVQTGIQDLESTKEENRQSKQKLIEQFQLKYDVDSVLRVCFDFDNNMIMIKTSEGKEDTIFFLDLEEHKEKILNCIGLETYSQEEIQSGFDAVLLTRSYEKASEEDRINFMQSFINFKNTVDEMTNYINQLETEIEISRELIKHQHEENKALKEKIRKGMN